MLKTSYSMKFKPNLKLDRVLGNSINKQYDKNVNTFLNTINYVVPRTSRNIKKIKIKKNTSIRNSNSNSNSNFFPKFMTIRNQKNHLNEQNYIIFPKIKNIDKDINPLNLFNITTVQKIINGRNNMKYARFSLLFRNRTKFRISSNNINLYQNPLTTREADINKTNNEVIFPLTKIKTETIQTEEKSDDEIPSTSNNVDNSLSFSENDEEENKDKFEININKHRFLMNYLNNPNNNFILTEKDKFKSRYQGDLFLHEKIKEIINQRYFMEEICNNKPKIKTYLINHYSILENKINFIEDINKVPSIKNNLIFMNNNENITYKRLINDFKNKIDQNLINYLVDDKTYLNLLFKIQVQIISKDKKFLTVEDKYTNINHHAYDEDIKNYINNKFSYPCNNSVSVAKNNLKNAIFFYEKRQIRKPINKDNSKYEGDELWFFKKYLGKNFKDLILRKKNIEKEKKNLFNGIVI